MKSIRLGPEAYHIGHCFSVTIVTANRVPLFADSSNVKVGRGALLEAAGKYQSRVFAYCFMPDHIHLLAATPPGVDFVGFIRQFKQLSAHRFRRLLRTRRPIWQARFHDHALRSEEGLLAAAQYILDNPVRAGIVSDAGSYPYSGSFVWEEALLVSGSEDPDLHIPSTHHTVADPGA